MGNLLGKNKMHEPQNSRNDDIRIGGRMSSSNLPTQKPIPLPLPLPLPPQATSSMSNKSTHDYGQSSNTKKSPKKYALIQDNFTTLEQVCFSNYFSLSTNIY
jgi:hypothetical protein